MGEESQREGRHRPLFELATIQHGVVSTRQLDELGYSPSSAAKAAGAGRLKRIHRGVYLVGHERLSWEGRCMAAVLAARPAVASHFSAGWLWGILRSRPGTVHVTAPTPRRAGRQFTVHCANLPAQDRARVQGIPVSGLARTLLDLAGSLSATGLERALEHSEELGTFDLVAAEDVLSRAGHHRGVARLRGALAIYREEPAFTRSHLERRFLALMRKAGLPTPSMNLNVVGYEVDAYWEPERFVVELDAFETHGSHAAFERDRLRHEDLKLQGIEMIRVTGSRLDREPRAVAERVAAHLEQRRRELAR